MIRIWCRSIYMLRSNVSTSSHEVPILCIMSLRRGLGDNWAIHLGGGRCDISLRITRRTWIIHRCVTNCPGCSGTICQQYVSFPMHENETNAEREHSKRVKQSSPHPMLHKTQHCCYLLLHIYMYIYSPIAILLKPYSILTIDR